MSKAASRALLVSVLILAAAVRLAGIGYLHFPDEAGQLHKALKIGVGEFYPNWFVGAYSYLMFLWYSAFFVLGALAGWWRSVGDFMGVYYTAPHVLYVAGRVAETLAGIAGVYCLYLLGRRLFSRTVGLSAAFFLALNITHVQVSQMARGQAFALLFGLLSLIFLERLVRKRRFSDAFPAGLFLAAAVSIRIFFLAYFLAAATAAVFLARSRRWKTLVSGALLFTLTFVVFSCLFTPELMIKPGELLFSMSRAAIPFTPTSRPSAASPWVGVENPLRAYLLDFMPGSLGWPLYLACWTGIAWGAFRLRRFGWALAVLLPLVDLLVMGRSRLAATRYLIPIFPLLLIAAAGFLHELLSRWGKPARAAWGALIVSGLLIAPGVPGIVRWDVDKNRLQTIDLAKEWILRNIPDRARIAVESTGYSGPNIRLYSVIDYDIYRMSPEELRALYAERMKTDPAGSRALRYFIDHPPKPWHRVYDLNVKEPVSADYLVGEGVEYIVLSSGVTQRDFAMSKYPDLPVTRPAFYSWVEANGDLIKSFPPSKEHPGPEIRVYRLKDGRKKAEG